jgi:hypothetical protein
VINKSECQIQVTGLTPTGKREVDPGSNSPNQHGKCEPYSCLTNVKFATLAQ